ncbi:uncharacterized protein LOC110735833 [Chenopodium quinoa]|uniref:uncharacterized protein LOC110735833 n=1 Tax=Chenopodium quinoa TaxID=63459 RepID=UPI000B7852F6|nr:uncharacterized protein LOC110735833 [Chenopodium quinoa]
MWYKLVLKVLANRLKIYLDKIICVNQSAFTFGRVITDNIFVAFELFHYMKNLLNKGGCMVMKLDMSKAYDRIEWDFLEVVLDKFGFAQNWYSSVMDCVRSVTFSVLVNGRPTDEFSPRRGFRQGDPISPYLFILCVEVFSHLLREAEEWGSLRGVRIAPSAPSISHLLFADDCIIFSRAAVNDAEVIQDILNTYELLLGQKINFDKTTISFSKGVLKSRWTELAGKLGVRIVSIHDRYLGLPTVVGRSKKVITRAVKEKLWKKLQGWKGKVLFKAGREVMVKVVAQSLPTYAMSVFKFPSSFCDELRSLVAQFWWGKKQGEPWRLLLKSGSLLEQVLKGRYYPNSSFLEADIGINPSYTWRGIAKARWVNSSGNAVESWEWCNKEFEITIHALRDYSLARDVWSQSRFAHVAHSRTSSILEWWEGCLAEFDDFDAASIITTCWAIWGAQNSWLAKYAGVDQLMVESDCLQVVNALRNKSSGSSAFFLVIDDILAFCNSFSNIKRSFVRRGGNKIAHELAHLQPWEVGQ